MLFVVFEGDKGKTGDLILYDVTVEQVEDIFVNFAQEEDLLYIHTKVLTDEDDLRDYVGRTGQRSKLRDLVSPEAFKRLTDQVDKVRE